MILKNGSTKKKIKINVKVQNWWINSIEKKQMF